MSYLLQGLKEAFKVLATGDPEAYRIALVSIKIASISTLLASIGAIPTGFWITFARFRGRREVIAVLRALLALPTVVVGLFLYSLLSRSGPFGELRLLYTQTAMVLGQLVLVFPIVTMLTVTALTGVDRRARPTAITLGASRLQSGLAVMREGSFALVAAIAAGFGRVFGEVGVSMMLGGNIRNYTRNLTTGIAFQTSRGEFSLGLALGFILLTIALAINLLIRFLEGRSSRSTA